MSHLINSAVVTQQLIDARGALLVLLGDKYVDRIAPVRSALRAWHKSLGLPLAQCALLAAKKLDAAGEDPSLIFAALVDELEAGR